MTREKPFSEEKIADGLYVAYDGEHYHLHAPRTANAIRLDDEAVRQFMLYVLRVHAAAQENRK